MAKKQLTLIIFFLFILFITPVLGDGDIIIPPEGSQNETGIIMLNGSPGAFITIDNNPSQQIPLSGVIQILSVKSGLRTLVASLSDYPVQSWKVPVYPNNTTTIHLNPFRHYGSIQINSTPSGAEAYLNGVRVGNTPVEASEMVIGDYSIRLQYNDYYPWEQRFSVRSDEKSELTANLIPMKSISPTPTPKSTGFTCCSALIIITFTCLLMWRERKRD